MTKYLACLAVAAFAGLALALPQGSQAPFSITISAPNDTYKVGSDIKIRLVFKNISSEEVPYTRELGTGVEAHGEFFSDIVVRDARGGIVPEMEYYRRLRGKADANADTVAPGSVPNNQGQAEPKTTLRFSLTGSMLKPGESREEEIDVSKLYDLSQSGRYTISASRQLWDITTDPRSKIVAKSNTLTITITK